MAVLWVDPLIKFRQNQRLGLRFFDNLSWNSLFLLYSEIRHIMAEDKLCRTTGSGHRYETIAYVFPLKHMA